MKTLSDTELALIPSRLWFNPYSAPVTSERTGAIFRLHPYSTKIDYRSIVPFILAHTSPGETVYDGFAGTCSTALAASACSEPNPSLLKGLMIPPGRFINWGPRKSVSVDVGRLPTFIGKTMLSLIDTSGFRRLVMEVMNEVLEKWGWLYEVEEDESKIGVLRYQILSYVMKCSTCHSEEKFVDLFVDFEQRRFRSVGQCRSCGNQIRTNNSGRATEEFYDDLLKTSRTRFKRVPISVYGKTGKRLWKRPPQESDSRLESRLSDIDLGNFARPVPMLAGGRKWGEMYRSGYHKYITHVHDFYTRRNFLALAILYGMADRFPEEMQDHYRLLVSSYNVGHSSLMTRFVFKKGNKLLVVTSGEPGTLYISGCPVEKNVFSGVTRKLAEYEAAMKQISNWKPQAEVRLRPAQDSGLPDNSIDYIFTDPPFAGNIQYSEINFLSEVWLDSFTNSQYETVISKVQAKGLDEYEKLLTDGFRENSRVLKPGHYMTVVFHNTRGRVWNVLRRALVNSGFQITYNSILDKEQTSFKQTRTRGAVKKDVILGLVKAGDSRRLGYPKHFTPREFIIRQLMLQKNKSSRERTSDYLFSRYIGESMRLGTDVTLDSEDFRKELTKVAIEKSGQWFLRRSITETG